ncbi:hypothetical protein GCM10027189_05090 [Rufibacter soli]
MAGATVQAQQVPAPHVVPVTIFYDLQHVITTKPKAAYIRVASLDTVAMVFKGIATDYYGNGQPYRQVNYEATGKEGSFQLFHPGKKLEVQGVFLANQPVGQWKFFYPDSKPMQTIEFLPNQDYKVLEYYNFLGQQLVKEGTGQWETTSRIKAGNIFMNLHLEGHWKNGVKTGQWVFLKTDGKRVYAEDFENGVFKRGMLYGPGGKTVIQTNTDQETEKWPFLMALAELEKLNYDLTAFGSKERALNYILKKQHLLPEDPFPVKKSPVPDFRPEFPGGQAALFRFLSSNFKIPKADMANGVDGSVVASFVVGADGKVTEAIIVRSLTPSVDAEVIRVIKMMPKWKPAMLKGQPVPFTYTFPYRITRK